MKVNRKLAIIIGASIFGGISLCGAGIGIGVVIQQNSFKKYYEVIDVISTGTLFKKIFIWNTIEGIKNNVILENGKLVETQTIYIENQLKNF